MNILCYRYGSIVEPDIIDGFKELGNQVSEICLEIYNKNTTPLEGLTALKDELMRHSYDFVFSINFYPFIAEVCNIFQIRYLCLTVDAPVLELFSNSIRLPWNRIFLFDRAQYEDFHPQNPECIFHLPLAGNPARYAPRHQERHPRSDPEIFRRYFVRRLIIHREMSLRPASDRRCVSEGLSGRYYGCTDAITRLLSSRRTAAGHHR